MRKQGLMKRVLGGIMAVAFGAALCFAAPVKAEAATPWTSAGYTTEGQIWAYLAREDAAIAADNVQYYLGAQQYYMNQQLAARTNIAQTTASAKMYLAALESGLAGLSLVPEAYRVPVATAIYQQQYALRQDAYSFINDNYVAEAIAKENQAVAYAMMQYNIDRQIQDMQIVQAGMLADATERSYYAQVAALRNIQNQIAGQVNAAYDSLWAAMGYSNPYGF